MSRDRTIALREAYLKGWSHGSSEARAVLRGASGYANRDPFGVAKELYPLPQITRVKVHSAQINGVTRRVKVSDAVVLYATHDSPSGWAPVFGKGFSDWVGKLEWVSLAAKAIADPTEEVECDE